MTNENSPPPAQPDPDEAPDLSTPDWRPRFARALLRAAPLEGVDLSRSSETGRSVSFLDAPTTIDTEEDYERALRAIETYFERKPEPGTPDAEAFNQLADQIRTYEDRHWQIPED